MPRPPRRRQSFSELLLPRDLSGWYYFANSQGANGTSAAQGNGTFRCTPWLVPEAMTIVRIGAEFTVAGEANSVLRLGIYTIDSRGIPAALVLDAGTISTGTGDAGTVATGGTPGVYDITVNQYVPRGWYAIGAAVQAAPTTQPTVRTVSANCMENAPYWGGSFPGAGAVHLGYGLNGVTAALPATLAGHNGGANSAPRIHIKIA